MKLTVRFYLVFLMLAMVMNSCQKPARTNYWDEKASYDPDTWAPSNLVLSVNGLNSVTLTWEQSKTVEGFVIERKTDDGPWQVLTGALDGSLRQFLDENVTLPATYLYRIYAFAGENTSSIVEKGLGLPIVSTDRIINISDTSATIRGIVVSGGGVDLQARGIVWNILQYPTLSDNQGITNNGAIPGSFISQLSILKPNAVYYVRAYATNSLGTTYGQQLSLTTLNFDDVYNPTTGRIWKDRNLGASRVANSSTDEQAYGALYQWGRFTDGHENRHSSTTSSLSSSDNPGHANFIINSYSPFDWRSPQNNNLWQGASGTNNPCPAEYRLPTEAEWEDERKSWLSNDAAGAYASPLKLSVAGNRLCSNGSVFNLGSLGSYWSATVEGENARLLYFDNSNGGMNSNHKADGRSIRCIKD